MEKKRENQENAILDLLKFLYEKYKKKVIILIDDLKAVFSGNEIEEVITENIIFSDLSDRIFKSRGEN